MPLIYSLLAGVVKHLPDEIPEKKEDKDLMKDDYIGQVVFDLNEVPKWVSPYSPLAPPWNRLEDRKGDKVKGELMLVVWIGTLPRSVPRCYSLF